MVTPHQIARFIEARPGLWSSEDELQERVFGVLAPLGFVREVAFTGASRIDLFCEATGVGVEVKITGSPAAILRQLLRYSGVPSVLGLVLATTKPVRVPDSLGGKPVAIAGLWKWGVL